MNWNKAKLEAAIAPMTVQELFNKMGLTASQQLYFWKSIPTIQRAIEMSKILPHVNFMECATYD